MLKSADTCMLKITFYSSLYMNKKCPFKILVCVKMQHWHDIRPINHIISLSQSLCQARAVGLKTVRTKEVTSVIISGVIFRIRNPFISA